MAMAPNAEREDDDSEDTPHVLNQHLSNGERQEHEACGASKLTLLPLIALIFFEVSGGPFGIEDAVKSGGPLLAILGFAFFPLVWCIPHALITAELCTAFPENSGYVLWVSSAFTPFWGFQVGLYQWLSGVIDNSVYPILFLDYLKHQFPVFEGGPIRVLALLLITAGLTYWNYKGLVIVGWGALLLSLVGVLPFLALSIFALPRIKPSRWLTVKWKQVKWRGYINNLFWNLNSWDSASTFAGEVEDPKTTFPTAVAGSLFLVLLVYLLPLLAATGAVPFSPSSWGSGYLAVIGDIVGGKWLGVWITASAALSSLGQFQAEMSSDTFQLLGMAQKGILPKAFLHRSRYGTPVLATLCSASGIVLLSWMSFTQIVEIMNSLYCVGMLLEIAAFVALRFSQPALPRPFSVPVGLVGAVLICIPPVTVLLLILSLASLPTILTSCVVGALGSLLYPLLILSKSKGWLQFQEQDSPSSSNMQGATDTLLGQDKDTTHALLGQDRDTTDALLGQDKDTTDALLGQNKDTTGPILAMENGASIPPLK